MTNQYPNEDLDKLHESLMDLIQANQNNSPQEVGNMLIWLGTSLLLDMAPNAHIGMRTALLAMETGIKNSHLHKGNNEQN